jgi:predicted nicotinamide N-methyase
MTRLRLECLALLATTLLASQADGLRAGKGFGFAYRYSFLRRGREALDVVLQAPEKVTVSSSAYAKALRALEPDVTGFSAWQAGETLCRYMVENHAKLPHGPRFELGSGLGLCGITLAMLDKDSAARAEASSKTSSTAAVFCTDRSRALLEHVKENARLNHVEALVSTCHLEWGSEFGVAELQKRLCTNEPRAASPALVIGSDLCYSIDALPSLVATISMLDAQLNLLSIRPRFVDESDGSSEELDALEDLTTAAGYEVKEVMREDSDCDAQTGKAGSASVELCSSSGAHRQGQRLGYDLMVRCEDCPVTAVSTTPG